MSQIKTFLNKAKSNLANAWQKILEWNRRLKKRPVFNVIVKFFLGIFLLIIMPLMLLIFSVRIGLWGGMPSNKDLRNISNPVGTELIADDGVTVFGRFFIENRTNATYDHISPYLIKALVATEDIRYYEHSGIDWKAWGRVLFKTIIKGEKESGGGSTISQQLAKNLYKRRSYWRGTTLINKLREIIIAQRLERMYSKEELLTLYFNTVSFGGNIYGVEEASKQLFNTTAKDLKLEEAAIMIGMLKATTKYNPLNNLDLAKKRRNTVFNKMEKYKFITAKAADSLSLLPVKLNVVKETHTEGVATYFREHARLDLDKVLEKLEKPDGSAYNVYTDGLKVFTSINLKLQDFAEKAVAEHIKELQDLYEQQLGWAKKPWTDTAFLAKAIKNTEHYKGLKAAGKSDGFIDSVFSAPREMEIYTRKGPEKKKMSPKDSLIYYLQFLTAGYLAADPSNGFIKAWVGGIDNRFFQYDHVKAKRHVGSTIKPIVYLSGLESGLRACEYYSNEQKTYPEYDGWSPKNYEGGYGGYYSMKGALTKSLNCATVDILLKTGIPNFIRVAKAVGITSEIPEEPSIGLGAVDISLFDMITAYSTIARRGSKPNLTYILKIEDQEGNVLIDNTKEASISEPVVNPEHADMIRDMMESVVNAGTGGSVRWKYDVREPLAGKTGTTQDNADGWFIAFNPHLITGAWVGGEYPEIHLTGGFTGAFTALPIVGKVLSNVEKDPILKEMVKDAFAPLSQLAKDSLNCSNHKGPTLDELNRLDSLSRDSSVVDSLDGTIDGLEDDEIPIIEPSSSRQDTSRPKQGNRIQSSGKNQLQIHIPNDQALRPRDEEEYHSETSLKKNKN